MKKLYYLFAVAAISLASCDNSPKEYTVTGTVESGNDGEKVYLMERQGRNVTILDSAVISIGKYTFSGVQDKPVLRYLSYTDGINDPFYTDFFLENGIIEIDLTYNPSEAKIKGTKLNNAFQSYKEEMDMFEKSGQGRDEYLSILKNNIDRNINNELGLYILNKNNYLFSATEMSGFLHRMPAEIKSGDVGKHLEEIVSSVLATEPGQQFTDLNLNTPDGEPVKLSDYAGKGKIVLVDFWASWCPPCRADMPLLVQAYQDYKDKGLEIVGISLDREGEAWKKGIKDLDITWPQMSDLQYWDSFGAKTYGVRSIPHLMLIDGEGKIIDRGFGGNKLQEKLGELLD